MRVHSTIPVGSESSEAPRPKTIDEEGACQFDQLDVNRPVQMTAEVSKWSDGRTTLECLSISQ
jgi:hypothetical protein